MLLFPVHATAHPLGSFTVNHYHGITVHPDRVIVRAVVDTAEIPTLQERPAEVGDYAARECAALARATVVEVDGRGVPVEVRSSAVEFPPGDAGLPTTRLTCVVEAGASGATVAVRAGYRDDRVGWREMTAVGAGVALLDPPVPGVSVTGELREYPDDLLSDPLDVRSVVLRVGAGSSSPAGGAAEVGGSSLPGVAARAFTSLAGVGDLTPLVGVLAVLLSLVLGASHAALPGHGKTVIAACLAGRAGTPRDALVVGATVTLTHTAGVLALGLLISATSAVAGEAVLRWLGLVSGLLVTVIGATLLRASLHHRRPAPAGHGHGHGVGRVGLVGLGVAGGLVPSPSALVVLLGAVALGRTWFGVLLVLGYGLGMAATLTAVGLLLVRLRDRLVAAERLRDRFTALPTVTAALVSIVGAGLALRAVLGW
ncbi:ABC-type nickel/cobalt efflux system permease component RcnA [Saccharothrix carnea]|uniref:ABC-type nickel/cobalt efflux system permease component RcnA n=1 Tax=Saccharothrix carnea TaxID=1280637 RepID=A0A2P8ICE2_SACCR|nr:High-affinity nickel-transporter [Saccharothrix carnea]PSL56110.1 ABC-type nickel/cobalt efflux system permease component RcnA [Saccharothrix carnea]